jgi:hypothetical protein
LVAVSTVGLEACKTLVDVGDEARLTHLTVIYDVYAKIDLLPHDIRHCLAHAGSKYRIVDLLTLPARDAHGMKIRRTRQASDMSRKNSIGAVLHGASLLMIDAQILSLLTIRLQEVAFARDSWVLAPPEFTGGSRFSALRLFHDRTSVACRARKHGPGAGQPCDAIFQFNLSARNRRLFYDIKRNSNAIFISFRNRAAD